MRRFYWLAALIIACLPALGYGQTSDTIPPTLDVSQSGYFDANGPVSSVDVTGADATVTVRLVLSDDLSGVTNTFYDEVFNLRSPSGTQRRVLYSYDFQLVSGDAMSGTWEASLTMPQGSEAGTWVIERIHARDVVGNRRYFFEYDPLISTFPTLTVVSNTDSTPPILTGLTLTPANPDTSAGSVVVNVALHVTDDQSGVNLTFGQTQSSLGLSSPPGFNFGRGCASPTLTSGTPLDGIWTAQCYFPQYSQAGDWKVEAGISDAAGNHRLYKETCQPYETDCVAFPTNDPNFPDTSIHLTSTPSDVTKPTLSGLSFSPNFIDTSLSDQTIQLQATGTDDLSGFDAVQLNVTSPSGGQTQTLYIYNFDPQTGVATGSATFPRYAEAGTWLVQSLFYYDRAFNYVYVSDSYDPQTGQYHTGAENIAALGFPTVLNVVKASLTGDGLIDPAVGGNGGGTVVDDAFGDRAQITLPPGAVATATDVTIDVLQSPLTLPNPTGFAGAGTNYVNFQFNPYPAMPLPAPGATITLPLLQGMALGTPIGLFRVDVDPQTGQAFLQQSLDVNGNPVIGYAGPPPAVTTPFTYTHPADLGSSEVDAITPDLQLTRASTNWGDGYTSFGVENYGADQTEWATGTCAVATTFYATHEDLLLNELDSLPGGVAGNLPGSDECLRDTTSGAQYDIHWLTWDQGDGEFSYQRTVFSSNGGGTSGCDESGCMSVTFYGVAHLSTVVGMLVDTDGDHVADVNDVFPNDPNEWADADFDGTGDNGDLDDDNDGTLDVNDAFPLDPSESLDTDQDGLGNNADNDDDNDGVLDAADAFPLDSSEWSDFDGDHIGDNADPDDDNDGFTDPFDAFPHNAAEWLDTDGDGTGNNADADDDGDGVLDVNDALPLDATESLDTDHDGIGNNADADDDNDGVADVTDAFPLDGNESVDTDHDGIGNNADADDDGDGVADVSDAFPLNPAESLDTDHDGIGNNADADDDNDGVADVSDAFPLNGNESVDTDHDGIGNNADADDDGDGVADVSDAFPLDPAESLDTDHDGIGNNADPDDDNDGVLDVNDPFPLDGNEWVDTDHDGIGNNADTDDDGDGVADVSDAFPLNPAESLDTDHDGIGNNADTDDDGDGVADVTDAFPLNGNESVDTDHDGIGNNADADDDGDGVPDANDGCPLVSGPSANAGCPLTTTDVSAQVGITYGGFSLNRATGRYVQTVTLRNNGGTTVNGPISLVLSGLSSNAALFQAAGATSVFYAGSPYKNLAPASLAPGTTTTITLEFTKTGSAGISYVGKVIAGPGTR